MRNLKTLVKAMMDDSERKLINFQKQNTLSFYSSEESEDDTEFLKVPSILKASRKEVFQLEVDQCMVSGA